MLITGFQATKITRIIFYANIIVFLSTLLIPKLFNYLAVYPFDDPKFHYYQMVTSMFTHAGLLHIFFNMIGLLSFGPSCEIELKERNFILFYLIAGVVGVILQMSFTSAPLVGASAGIFALMVFSTLLNPNQKVQIIFFPFVTFKAKWLVGFFVLLEIYAALSGKKDGIGHLAHLGGVLVALFTFTLIKIKKQNG